MQGLPTTLHEPPPQPLQLGRYEVLGRVAVGGMSEIFLAHEQLLGEPLRRVAIKLLRSPARGARDSARAPEGALRPGADLGRAEAQFAREGRTLLRLDHPNICHSYELGRLADRVFIAMEWVDGLSLRELVLGLRARGETLPLGHAVNLIAQVAAGLQHAHAARDAHNEPLFVVHRDVNPTNIMVRYDGVVKLIDFGVAQAVEVAHAPIAEQIEGKLSYMAPEQIRGEPLDARADIFALGVCLFEIVAGTRLYRRKLPEQVRAAVLLGEVPCASFFNPAVPPELDAIIQRALQKDASARFQDAAALQEALEELLVANNLPMGARPLATLMERLLSDRPITPTLSHSAELQELVWEAEALNREQNPVRVLSPQPVPWESEDEQPLPELASGERSGARAVGARPSDHACLEPRPPLRSPRLYLALAATAALALASAGYLVSARLAPRAVAALPVPPLPRAAALATPAAPTPQTEPMQAAKLGAAQAVEPAQALEPAQVVQAALAIAPHTDSPDVEAASPVVDSSAPSPRRSAPSRASDTAAPEPSLPSAAHPDDTAAARALFQVGVSQAARQQYRAAVESLAQADALQPAPATTIHWANALYELAHFAEAYQRLSTLDHEGALAPELSRPLDKLKAKLEAHVTRLTIELPPDAIDMHVLLDRLHMPRTELGSSRGLTPGRHQLEVRQAGRLLVQRVLETAAGEHIRCKVAADGTLSCE